MSEMSMSKLKLFLSKIICLCAKSHMHIFNMLEISVHTVHTVKPVLKSHPREGQKLAA